MDRPIVKLPKGEERVPNVTVQVLAESASLAQRKGNPANGGPGGVNAKGCNADWKGIRRRLAELCDDLLGGRPRHSRKPLLLYCSNDKPSLPVTLGRLGSSRLLEYLTSEARISSRY